VLRKIIAKPFHARIEKTLVPDFSRGQAGLRRTVFQDGDFLLQFFCDSGSGFAIDRVTWDEAESAEEEVKE
jgi:hypothetical protein